MPGFRIGEEWSDRRYRSSRTPAGSVRMSFGAHACDGRGQRNCMTRKTVILTEIIAPYRIPVFNALARRAGVDLHVIFLAETDKTLRKWRVYKNEIRFSHQVLPSWRWRAGKSSFLFNRGLWSALNQVSPQVVICGGYNY